MPDMIDLNDLLKHEIIDLYSAEEQIIEALPKMVEKATNPRLKKALADHLKVTEGQKKRLDEIKGWFMKDVKEDEPKGFFSKLFGGSEGDKCKGTEGLIKEGEKIMGEDMTAEVMDAAIIGSAQKIEHYEISGYGTAVAYAKELKLSNVAALLQQTLDEEYEADDSLTKLAVEKLNIKAEKATAASSNGSRKKSEQKKSGSSKSGSSKRSTASNSTRSGSSSKKGAAKKTASKRISVKKSPSKSSANRGSRTSASKSARKNSQKAGAGGKSRSSKKR